MQHGEYHAKLLNEVRNVYQGISIAYGSEVHCEAVHA